MVSPRTERSVGGLMAVTAFVDALAPNLTLPLIGRIARLGWRRRDAHPPESADALSQPTTSAELHTPELSSRPSLLVRLRDLSRIGR